MPPHRRPPGAGVARISSSSSDEEKEESTAKDVNEQVPLIKSFFIQFYF